MKSTFTKREISQRWTVALTTDGWTPISNFFLENYHRLDPALNHPEALLIIHLIAHKWDEQAPYPSISRLAKRMGISTTAARKHARRLHEKGYVRREARSAKSNAFHFDGLFAALERLLPLKALREVPCPKCKTVSDNSARFCKSCGTRLQVDNEPALDSHEEMAF